MAICDNLKSTAAATARTLREYTSIANSALAAGLSGSAEVLNDRRNDVIAARDILSSNIANLRRIRNEQEQNGCIVEGYVPELRAAEAALSRLSTFITQAGQKVEQLIEQEAKATTQSTTKENNQGTGKPGTAGQGSEASKPKVNTIPSTTETTTGQIQEFTVTGTRPTRQQLTVPEPTLVDPGQVKISAPPNINLPEEELEEVTVQGNRIKDRPIEVTEPVLTEVGPIDLTPTNINLPEEELEEVTVTGRRVPTTTGAVQETRNQASLREETNFQAKKDWRVRLSLAPGTNYLYNDDSNYLLEPLRLTDGILFPYTPSINVTYAANYSPASPAHSNYKFFQYENSYVDNISIGCDFTAQDSDEATYVLAVIHFLRSVTKMFYGQDQNPKLGTPPPLCYLFGLGQFQFNAHPLAITSFNYNLPVDVDYIRVPGNASTSTGDNGLEEVTVTGKRVGKEKTKSSLKQSWGVVAENFIKSRLSQGIAGVGGVLGLNLSPGGEISSSNWVNSGFNPQKFTNVDNPTYVPTKININIGAVPMVSRYEVSSQFSLKKYATGELLNGVGRKGAGFW